MTQPIPTFDPMMAPAAGLNRWRRVDRIASYVFAVLIVGIGVVSPFAILIYGLFD